MFLTFPFKKHDLSKFVNIFYQLLEVEKPL